MPWSKLVTLVFVMSLTMFAVGPQVGIVYLPIDSDLIKRAVIGDVSVQFNWYW